jgi:trimethylamine:corrinoid methyltransferase-like protein
MKTAALLPKLADRESRDTWEANGALDTHARAMLRMRDILARESAAVFSPEIDARIKDYFPGLVAGNLEMSE